MQAATKTVGGRGHWFVFNGLKGARGLAMATPTPQQPLAAPQHLSFEDREQQLSLVQQLAAKAEGGARDAVFVDQQPSLKNLPLACSSIINPRRPLMNCSLQLNSLCCSPAASRPPSACSSSLSK